MEDVREGGTKLAAQGNGILSHVERTGFQVSNICHRSFKGGF